MQVDAAATSTSPAPTASDELPRRRRPLRGVDVFVAKLDSRGALLYSAYVGGIGRRRGPRAGRRCGRQRLRRRRHGVGRLPDAGRRGRRSLAGEHRRLRLQAVDDGRRPGLLDLSRRRRRRSRPRASRSTPAATCSSPARRARPTCRCVAARQARCSAARRVRGALHRRRLSARLLDLSTEATGPKRINGSRSRGRQRHRHRQHDVDGLSGHRSGVRRRTPALARRRRLALHAVGHACSSHRTGAARHGRRPGGRGERRRHGVRHRHDRLDQHSAQPAPIQAQAGGGLDAFILVVTPGGGVAMSTYYGGTRSERGRAIAINAAGRLVMVGRPCRRTCRRCGRRRPRRAATAIRSSCRWTALHRGDLLDLSRQQQQRRGHGCGDRCRRRVFVAGAASYPFPVHAGRRRMRSSTAFRPARRAPTATVTACPTNGKRSTAWTRRRRRRRRSRRGRRLQRAGARQQHPPARLLHSLSRRRIDRNVLRRSGRAVQPVELDGRRAAALSAARRRPPRSSSWCRWRRCRGSPSTPRSCRASRRCRSPRWSRATRRSSSIGQMTWDAPGFGSHAETSSETASTQWFLAEGATGGTFELFYLLQNPTTGPR